VIILEFGSDTNTRARKVIFISEVLHYLTDTNPHLRWDMALRIQRELCRQLDAQFERLYSDIEHEYNMLNMSTFPYSTHETRDVMIQQSRVLKNLMDICKPLNTRNQ